MLQPNILQNNVTSFANQLQLDFELNSQEVPNTGDLVPNLSFA